MSIFSQPEGYIPPDPIGAAGLSSLIAVTNAQIECLRKNGTVVFGPTPLKTMFSETSGSETNGSETNGVVSPAPEFLFDPKIIYDVHRNRFVLVVLEKNQKESVPVLSRIRVAVSKDGDPRGTNSTHWHFLQIDSLVSVGRVETFADYPGIAVDAAAVYITANMFSVSGDLFQKPLLWILAKEPMYSGAGPPIVSRYDFTAGQGNPLYWNAAMPAMVRKPGGIAPGVGTYLVAHDIYSTPNDCYASRVRIVQINRPLGNTTFQFGFVDLGDIGSDFCRKYPDAPQRGAQGGCIDTGDDRVYQAMWVNDQLWVTMTVVDALGQTAASWLKFHANGTSFPPAFVGRGRIDGEDIQPGTFTAFPSLDVNSKGVAAFGFAAFGPGIYGGAYASIRDDLVDPPGTARPADVVREGEGPYYIADSEDGERENRWGDYSGMSLDPADDNCFWAFNQYSGNETYDGGLVGSWRTAWARLCYRRTCRLSGERCARVETCCAPANKVCEGFPKTCKVCKLIGQNCTRRTECCSPANLCEGPAGQPRNCKVCKSIGQNCTRRTECCSPANLCEGPAGQPRNCKVCKSIGQNCTRRTECCSPANLCEGPAGQPRNCKVCKSIGQNCTRRTECCSPANLCEGPAGQSRKCKVCKSIGQTCTRPTECCSSSNKVCEAKRGKPKICKLCRKLDERCARSSQCCRGLACSNRQCRPT
jgi:hypothetical protein